MSTTLRSTARWQKLRAHVLATHPPVCGTPRCLHPRGRAIDLSLSGLRKWGPTVHHIVELEDGGAMWDETNLTPAHRSCNVAAGNHARNARRRASINVASANSHRWWIDPGEGGIRSCQPAPAGRADSDPLLSSRSPGGSA